MERWQAWSRGGGHDMGGIDGTWVGLMGHGGIWLHGLAGVGCPNIHSYARV